MTKAEKTCRLLGIPLDDQAVANFRYLQERGYRFAVHFGYNNAAEIADFHRREEVQEKTVFLRRDQVDTGWVYD